MNIRISFPIFFRFSLFFRSFSDCFRVHFWKWAPCSYGHRIAFALVQDIETPPSMSSLTYAKEFSEYLLSIWTEKWPIPAKGILMTFQKKRRREEKE